MTKLYIGITNQRPAGTQTLDPIVTAHECADQSAIRIHTYRLALKNKTKKLLLYFLNYDVGLDVFKVETICSSVYPCDLN